MDHLYKVIVSSLVILFVFNLAGNGKVINKTYSVTSVKVGEIKNENKNYFSIGWSNYLYHFTINPRNYKYPNRYLFSDGYELIASYHLNSDLSFSTGITYQNMMYQTKIKNQKYLPSIIQSVVLHDIGIPLFLKLSIYRSGNQLNSISLIPGFYLWIPSQALNAENFKVYGGQGYVARSISYALCEKYYSLHLGIGFSKHLTEKLNINIEPFINYQLNHKLIIDLDEELWYGFKVCINYSLKK